MAINKLNRRHVLILSIAAAAGVAALGSSHWARHSSNASGPGGAAFSLVDATGRGVSDTDFRGKVMLIYFGYTFCPDICPTTLARVVEVHSGLPPGIKAQVVPIFITVDPDRDTQDQIGPYVSSFSPDLVGLTGSHEQIDAAEHAYGVFAEKAGGGEGYTVDHSSLLYVVGKDGKLRRKLKGDAPPDEIAAAVKDVL